MKTDNDFTSVDVSPRWVAMQRTLLHAKLYRVTCTHAELDDEGSVVIDGRLLDAADIRG